MLLVFDIGNTTVLIGVFEADRLMFNRRIPCAGRPVEELSGQIKKVVAGEVKGIEGIIVSSVVPAFNLMVVELCEELFGIVPVFTKDIDPGIKIACDNPGEVGSDRIAVALAAKTLYGQPVVVVDFGTAVTVDVINDSGAYCGGMIAPGIRIMAKALHEHTALLPEVEMDFKGKKSVVGSNTVDCIRNGVYYGFLGQVRELVSRAREEVKGAPVIATGGYAENISNELSIFDEVHPLIILDGLRILHDISRKT